MRIFRIECTSCSNYRLDDFFESYSDCECYADAVHTNIASIRSAEVSFDNLDDFLFLDRKDQIALWEKAFADELAKEE